MKQFILVGIGGAAGSMLRYLTSILTERLNPVAFPVATFASNILGCFLIGIFIGTINISDNKDMRLLLITGFCGGYTTFSAFASENLALLQSNNVFISALYISVSVFAGIVSVWLGTQVSVR